MKYHSMKMNRFLCPLSAESLRPSHACFTSFQTTSKHRSRKKSSGKSKALLKSFIPKKFYRKQDQKQKILPLSPQLLRTISIHHLEPKHSKQSDTSTSRSTSISAKGSFHGNFDIMEFDSSSRNENDYLLPRQLNVIQGISYY
jgi:hypothetical protein